MIIVVVPAYVTTDNNHIFFLSSGLHEFIVIYATSGLIAIAAYSSPHPGLCVINAKNTKKLSFLAILSLTLLMVMK